MERERFNSTPESSDGEGDKKDEKSAKKKAKSATDLARLLHAREDSEPAAKSEQSAKQIPERRHREPEATEPNAEDEAEVATGEAAEQSGNSAETAPLDELSAAEQTEVAQTIIDERLEHIAADEAADEADAASAALLARLRERLATRPSDSEQPLDEVIEEVYNETAAGLAGEAADDEPVDDYPEELPPDQPVPLNAAGGGAVPPPRRPIGAAGRRQPDDEPWHNRLVPPAVPAVERPADTVSRREAAYHERQAQARGLLVGGVVGYLLGRRRGRIKTEKRRKSVESKLMQQVSQIETQLSEKEAAIRRLARQRSAETLPLPVRQNRGRETAVSLSQKRPEQSTSRQAPDKEIVERAPRPAAEVPASLAEAAQPTIETMSKAELLTFAATIKVGETNLRRVYEAQLVDERGLRRLMREQQAGHDLRRALAREFLVKELKFERDPTLQDVVLAEQAPREQQSDVGQSQQANGGASTAEGRSIKVRPGKLHGPAAGQPTSPAVAPMRPPRRRQAQVSPVLLVGLTAATIGLAIYALWLTITR